jgi:hypothetical protein
MKSIYKLPCSDSAKNNAESYAVASLNFTHSYAGWENESGTERQKQRITIGRFGQEWLYEFCKFNQIPCEKDSTSPEENDKYDLIICKKTIDVKTTYHQGLIGQVSPGCIRNEKTSVYCFMLTNKEMEYIEPIGFVSKKVFVEHAQLIPFDAEIRNTGIKQLYKEGSYFIDRDYIKDFYEAIGWFVNYS